MEIPIVIPSHKRADCVTTTKLVPSTILCVAANQAEEYRRHNPGIEIVTHPDDLQGISLKRNWIYRKFGDVFMLDDDLTRMVRRYLGPHSIQSFSVPPGEAYGIIQTTAQTARDLGAYLFGFASTSDARSFIPQRPLRLSGYVNAYCMGLLKGSKVFFHKDAVVCEDYFASLINAYYHRYCFCDRRYGFVAKRTFKNAGGLSEFRTVKAEEEGYKFLRKTFGDVVQKRRQTKVTGKAAHEWQRVLKMPF
jgi:hypothetical protein